jgi:hypothetical protein
MLGVARLETHPLGRDAAILEATVHDGRMYVCHCTVEAKKLIDPGNEAGRPFDTTIEGVDLRIAIPGSYVGG